MLDNKAHHGKCFLAKSFLIKQVCTNYHIICMCRGCACVSVVIATAFSDKDTDAERLSGFLRVNTENLDSIPSYLCTTREAQGAILGFYSPSTYYIVG